MASRREHKRPNDTGETNYGLCATFTGAPLFNFPVGRNFLIRERFMKFYVLSCPPADCFAWVLEFPDCFERRCSIVLFSDLYANVSLFDKFQYENFTRRLRWKATLKFIFGKLIKRRSVILWDGFGVKNQVEGTNYKMRFIWIGCENEIHLQLSRKFILICSHLNLELLHNKLVRMFIFFLKMFLCLKECICLTKLVNLLVPA